MMTTVTHAPLFEAFQSITPEMCPLLLRAGPGGAGTETLATAVLNDPARGAEQTIACHALDGTLDGIMFTLPEMILQGEEAANAAAFPVLMVNGALHPAKTRVTPL